MLNNLAQIVKRETKALVFDQYGTIVDMQSGLVEMVTPFLKNKGWAGNPNQFVTWWRRKHFEDSMIDSLIDNGHTPYRQIGHRAVSHVMDRAEIAYSQNDVEWLISCIEKLKPFPDVVKSLEALKNSYRLCILSNGDRDMLETAKKYIGFNFDLTISVQKLELLSPTGELTPKLKKLSIKSLEKLKGVEFFLLPIMHLIASVRRLTDLGPCSSIDANDPLGKVHSSLTLLLKTSMNCQIS